MERQSEGRSAGHGAPWLDLENQASSQRRGAFAHRQWADRHAEPGAPGEGGDGGGGGKGFPDMAFDPVAAALRQMHERVVAEPVPGDFLRLLDQLDGDDDGGNAG